MRSCRYFAGKDPERAITRPSRIPATLELLQAANEKNLTTIQETTAAHVADSAAELRMQARHHTPIINT